MKIVAAWWKQLGFCLIETTTVVVVALSRSYDTVVLTDADKRVLRVALLAIYVLEAVLEEGGRGGG